MEHDPAKSDGPDVMPGGACAPPSHIGVEGWRAHRPSTPGSLAIPPAIAAVINNVLLFDMNIQQAINAPRALAISRFDSTITVEEKRFDEETLKALEAYGYILKPVGDYSSAVGGIAAIYLDRENNTSTPAATRGVTTRPWRTDPSPSPGYPGDGFPPCGDTEGSAML